MNRDRFILYIFFKKNTDALDRHAIKHIFEFDRRLVEEQRFD
jgi:hypothetical protein